MSKVEGIRWFKHNFSAPITAKLKNTPLTLDLIAAIAVQESFDDAWGLIYQNQKIPDVLMRCVGDTLDAPSRSVSAFPQNRTALEALATPDGKQMFTIARAALVDLATFSRGYKSAVKKDDKFCHAYGIFQYDIQFFQKNSGFFLQKKWSDFGACLELCVGELSSVARTLFPNKPTLAPEDLVYVAVGYNIGARKVRVGKGFNQGFKSGNQFYGQNIWDYMHLASTVT
jgi:hypothetical protein